MSDSSLNYERVHQLVEDNAYHSVGEVIMEKIQHTEWYNHTPYNFDLVKNFNDVKAICGDSPFCWTDSLNWSIMNKSELTADIYKFISHRAAVIRNGFETNFLPKGTTLHDIMSYWPDYSFKSILNLIDWNFLLDCISWFF